MGHSGIPQTTWRQMPLTVGGTALHDLIETRRAVLVTTMKGRIRTELPSYAHMTQDEFDGWVTRVCHRLVDHYVACLRDRELPAADDLRQVRDTATRRASAGVPMDEVLTAFYIGTAVITDEVVRVASLKDAPSVVALQAFGLDFLRVISSVVGTGYAMERQSILGEELAARQTLAADLLAGTATDESAMRAGVRLPPAYVVVAFSLVGGDEEQERRAIRSIRNESTRVVDEPVLWASPRTGWLALVPYAAGLGTRAADDRLWLATTHRDVQQVVELPIFTGWAIAAPADVPDAARLAREVCDVALASHRPPGIYELDDVLIDYQLMRPGPGRDRLEHLLSPLAARPELLQTLRTYMETGRDRRRTAQLLHLHPNSVDNRISRCADLTGLNAADPEEAILVRAALLT